MFYGNTLTYNTAGLFDLSDNYTERYEEAKVAICCGCDREATHVLNGDPICKRCAVETIPVLEELFTLTKIEI